MHNNDEALQSISLVGHGQLMEMLITLEPNVYFDQTLLPYTFYIVWPQVCKTGTKLCQRIRLPRLPPQFNFGAALFDTIC